MEKPIRVQVAEALNTYHTEHLWEERDWVNQGCAYCDNNRDEPCAPRYDLDAICALIVGLKEAGKL